MSPFGAGRERGIVLFFRRVGQARRHRHAVHINPPAQFVDSLPIGNFGGAKTEITLRGGKGKFAVVPYRRGGNDEAVGKGIVDIAHEEEAPGASGEVKQVAIDVVTALESPGLQRACAGLREF